jgi:hypothetical protein
MPLSKGILDSIAQTSSKRTVHGISPLGRTRFLAGGPVWIQRGRGLADLLIVLLHSGSSPSFTSSRSTLSNRSSNTRLSRRASIEFGKGSSGEWIRAVPPRAFHESCALPSSAKTRRSQACLRIRSYTVRQHPSVNPSRDDRQHCSICRLFEVPNLGLDLPTKRNQDWEGRTLTFRADAIDALNTPQWNNPTTDITRQLRSYQRFERSRQSRLTRVDF